MSRSFFTVLHRSKKSKTRLGEIRTVHGVIKTPAFVSVATKGTIKAFLPSLIKDVGQQVSFVNTYHLVTHPGVEVIEKAGGIHRFSQLDIPLMSDSGGFQVFSLAKRNRDSETRFLSQRRAHRVRRGPLESEKNAFSSSRKVLPKQADIRGEEEPLLVKISEDGVIFRSVYDGKTIEFTPEKSIEYQTKIGADMMMAFDECTYYPATHEYTERSMGMTHEWLKRCVHKLTSLRVNELPHRKTNSLNSLNSQNMINNQFLYGIIQGGMYEDLRKKSAEFVVGQDTDGVAIGGVSVGESKKEMRDQVRWVSEYLPDDRPVHLLGVGQFDDVVDLVKYGVDTFDCVEPTRLARVGRIYQSVEVRHQKQASSPLQSIDILKSFYKDNLEPVDVHCRCYVCTNFTKAYLHHLFKQREILGYTLATYHNLFVMNNFFERLRKLIAEDQL